MNWIELIWLSVLTVIVIAGQWPIWRVFTGWNRYKKARETLLEKLSDPDQIGFTEERVSEIRQARAANRTTMPREDAGKPAMVHRPKAMRTKLPSRWNPPADYNSRLR